MFAWRGAPQTASPDPEPRTPSLGPEYVQLFGLHSGSGRLRGPSFTHYVLAWTCAQGAPRDGAPTCNHAGPGGTWRGVRTATKAAIFCPRCAESYRRRHSITAVPAREPRNCKHARARICAETWRRDSMEGAENTRRKRNAYTFSSLWRVLSPAWRSVLILGEPNFWPIP